MGLLPRKKYCGQRVTAFAPKADVVVEIDGVDHVLMSFGESWCGCRQSSSAKKDRVYAITLPVPSFPCNRTRLDVPRGARRLGIGVDPVRGHVAFRSPALRKGFDPKEDRAQEPDECLSVSEL